MAIIGQQTLPKQDMTIAEFKAWLRRFDTNRDGQINVEELQRALQSLRAGSAWRKARRGMKEADANGDGVIDKDEIERLVDYVQRNFNMKIRGAK